MSTELSELAIMAAHLQNLDSEIEVVEGLLSQLKRDRQVVSREFIPSLMADVGVKEFKLDNGSEIIIQQKYYANISEERSVEAFKWLRDNGQEALIKTFIINDFGAGLEDKVDLQMLTNFLQEHEIIFSKKESVHPQTLKAFVKTQSENKEFPTMTFGVFVTDETVVNKPKQK